MVCIYCGKDTQVVNSRHQRRNNQIWRRRQCVSCKNIFTSVEQASLAGSVVIRKNSKDIEPFSREKLFLDIYDCLKHRKTAVSDAKALSDTIISRLIPRIKDASLTHEDIIESVSEVLRRFDKAAHVHYLAFHKDQ